MWLDRPPLCAQARKAVRNTIDGTLKSYILICVRCYSLINILSRAHRTKKKKNPSLSHFPRFLPPYVPIIQSYTYVNVRWADLVKCGCAFIHLRMCVCVSARKRHKKTDVWNRFQSPGICAYLVDSLHSSDSSDCTWGRTLGRIWKRAQNKRKKKTR